MKVYKVKMMVKVSKFETAQNGNSYYDLFLVEAYSSNAVAIQGRIFLPKEHANFSEVAMWAKAPAVLAKDNTVVVSGNIIQQKQSKKLQLIVEDADAIRLVEGVDYNTYQQYVSTKPKEAVEAMKNRMFNPALFTPAYSPFAQAWGMQQQQPMYGGYANTNGMMPPNNLPQLEAQLAQFRAVLNNPLYATNPQAMQMAQAQIAQLEAQIAQLKPKAPTDPMAAFMSQFGGEATVPTMPVGHVPAMPTGGAVVPVNPVLPTTPPVEELFEVLPIEEVFKDTSIAVATFEKFVTKNKYKPVAKSLQEAIGADQYTLLRRKAMIDEERVEPIFKFLLELFRPKADNTFVSPETGTQGETEEEVTE